MTCLFFFSSRRRHTRCSRDWSSDVCSSDLEQRLAGEANLIALDRKHLHQHLIAQLEFVADVADALLSNLADVKQPIRAGKDLDKGAEFGQAHDLAEVSLADLGGGGDLADHL